MVKSCSWGLCKSNSRKPDREEGIVTFYRFPQPKKDISTCRRWVRACGRPHYQLNVEILDGDYNRFVCSKHFLGGQPSEQNPDPIPVHITPLRRPQREQNGVEPPKKRRKILGELDIGAADNTLDSSITTETFLSSHKENANPRPPSDPPATTSSFDKLTEPSALDMLALAADNQQLQQQLAKHILESEALRQEAAQASIVKERNNVLQQQLANQILKNDELRRDNLRVKDEVKKSQQEVKQILQETTQTMCIESIRDSPIKDSFKYYTGFIFAQFMCIFNFLVPNKSECPMKFKVTMTSIQNMKLEDQFLLTMVKLRLNLEFKHLGYLFNISNTDAGRLFRTWINYMFHRFGSVPTWPDREILKAKMPQKFKEDFPDTMLILDGTEIKTQRPSSLRTQSQCYSEYKSSPTLKGLVGIDPRGSFTFISMLFAGSISDKLITAKSGLLDVLQQLLDCGKLKKGDGVMVDKGFLIREEIEKLGLKLCIPPFASTSSQMSAAEVALTRKIARHRVHVERAISRAKKFKIVDNRVDLSLFPTINQIWFCCCFLTNFMPYLIQD